MAKSRRAAKKARTTKRRSTTKRGKSEARPAAKRRHAAQNKTQETGASVSAFVESIADEARRQDCRSLLKLMMEVTKTEPRMWGESIVGFGRYRYTYESGREGEWFRLGFSPRKEELTLYLMTGFDRYGALLDQLGRHRTGRSCLYIKRLADVDVSALRTLLSASVRDMEKEHD